MIHARRLLRTLVMLATLVTFAFPALAFDAERHVITLTVSKRSVDFNSPWQYEDVVQQTHLGVILPGGRILTTASAVANVTFMEMSQFGSSARHGLTLDFVDYEVNLALVKPERPEALEGLKPIQLADELDLDQSVDIYRAREASKLIKLAAKLQDVTFLTPSNSAMPNMMYLLKTQEVGLGWTEPVFFKDELVGFCVGQDPQYALAIPSSVIEHFLKDVGKKPYRGFPAIGIELTSLASPDMRRHLKVETTGQGMRVSHVVPGSPFADKLRENDVVMAIDGTPIDDQGHFKHPKWGLLDLKYLIQNHHAGDEIRLEILRHGERLTMKGRLIPFDSNLSPVVAYSVGKPVPHLIFAGLVFQELSGDYLKQWGKDWWNAAPLNLVGDLILRNHLDLTKPRRLVFLSRILADPVNRGYGDLARETLDEVNGKKISSMDDLRSAFAAPIMRQGRAYAVIKFSRGGGEVILAYDTLSQAHVRIARNYEISSPDSFYRP